MLMRLAEAARAMNGRLVGDDAEFRAVATDSRKALDGALFVALRGGHFDGHDYVAAARGAGAVAAVVSRDDETFGAPRIVVDDTLLALGRLAAAWRSRCAARVIAITGNSGKTTTKEFVAAVLRRGGATHATAGNLNNEIGVPLTLFGLGPEHRFAVIEMGQGRQGDIAYLVGIARPDIAVVTNVTGAHLAGFGSLDAIAEGKGEVYAKLPADGVAIINLDDHYAAAWRESLPRCRVLTFGLEPGADVHAIDARTGDDGCAHFVLSLGDARALVKLGVPGIHNVSNALAAAAIGHACGIGIDDIVAALADVRPVAGRLVVRTAPGGARVIDDTYNANPGSVKAAIRTLCGFHGRRLLALGHMAELGPTAAELHREVGAYARAMGVDGLFAVGEHAAEAVAGFGAGAYACADVDALVAALRPELAEGVTVLVKGSRSARMERVVAAITGDSHAAVAH